MDVRKVKGEVGTASQAGPAATGLFEGDITVVSSEEEVSEAEDTITVS